MIKFIQEIYLVEIKIMKNDYFNTKKVKNKIC